MLQPVYGVVTNKHANPSVELIEARCAGSSELFCRNLGLLLRDFVDFEIAALVSLRNFNCDALRAISRSTEAGETED